MADPGLAQCLAGITVPTLVVWGEADQMMTSVHDKEYAAAMPAPNPASCRAPGASRSWNARNAP
jgi:pimeloyl-ACP methyl ester carboxylesterase